MPVNHVVYINKQFIKFKLSVFNIINIYIYILIYFGRMGAR